MSHIPTPIRAALGLAATAVAEARRLPETLPQLPVTAVSTAMQASLRVQQHIATFAARGDEVISQLRGSSAEPPSWATFDDSPAANAVDAAKSGAASAAGTAKAAFDRATPDLVNLEDTGADGADGASRSKPGDSEPAHPIASKTAGKSVESKAVDTITATPGEPAMSIAQGDGVPPVKKAPVKAVAKKAPPAKAPAKKAPAKKAPAKKAARRSEPLVEAAKKADPSAGPNPSTMAAEILHAHEGESPAGQ